MRPQITGPPHGRGGLECLTRPAMTCSLRVPQGATLACKETASRERRSPANAKENEHEQCRAFPHRVNGAQKPSCPYDDSDGRIVWLKPLVVKEGKKPDFVPVELANFKARIITRHHP